MTRLALVATAAAALLGLASAARMTGRNPYYLGYGGGVVLYINGEGFSEDQFSQFDPSLGNRVSLVNGEDEIECKVIQYLTNTNRIVCSTGPRTRPSAPTVYDIVIYSDGVRAEGSSTVNYAWWVPPKIQTVTPLWSLPGQEVRFNGWLQTAQYYQINVDDPLEANPDRGAVLTKVFLGGVECDLLDENEELRGTFSGGELTCLPRAKLIGAMNSSLFVTERGSSVTDRHKMYVDSQDKLYQYHSYPAISGVSPSSGSLLGGTLVTVDGIGFDPYQDQTKVEVGGVECSVQEITDDQLKCLTPAEGQIESPGAGERGILVELFKGETATDAEFYQAEKWAALDSSHAGYEALTNDVQELSFPLVIGESALGRVRALLHPPHDGEYMVLGTAGNKGWVLISPDGNPENAVSEQPIELKKGTPAYVEFRFRTDGDTDLLIRMKDFNARYVNSQTFRALNPKMEVKLDIHQVFETQAIAITGTPTPATLFINGISSAPVDIADSAQVREALLDMTEQKCDKDFSGLNVRHFTDFEDGERPPGALGSVVDDVQPYCGRKLFRLKRTDPRVYRVTDQDKMVDANVHKYLCFAIQGNLQTSMAVNLVWKDNRGKNRDDTFWFERPLSASSWTYHCEDLQEVIFNSWAAAEYTAGAKLLVKNVVVPKAALPTEEVHIDEVVFVNEAVTVSQTRPSALKQQNVLVSDVEVQEETETGYELRFITSNCMAGMPLLGVFDGEADNSLLEVLSTSDSYTFPIGEASVAVSRQDAATSPLAGTWDLLIQGRVIPNIPADIDYIALQAYLESALGSEIVVTRGGSCRNYQYDIEWLDDPGRKEMVVVDDSNLVFDGEVTVSVRREWEGMIWHDPLYADFMTAYRDTPHVTVRVNGYSAACQNDCAFSFTDAGGPTYDSSSISEPTFTDAVTIEVYGGGFTSNDLSDYGASLGDVECAASAIDNSQDQNSLTVSCDISVAGVYTFSVRMQPYGVFYTGSITLNPTITSLSVAEGPMTAYFPITVFGSGFPSDAADWEADSSYVKIDEADCEVLSGDATEVTCMVPPREAASGSLVVSVFVAGADASYDGFTYTAVSEVPTISSLSASTLSVYGGEELVITGTTFGSSEGTVKIGSEPCEVTSWAAESVTCTTPSLAPGSYSVSLLTDGLGLAETSVDYVFTITSASKLKGSVKGGTTVTLKGEGFGSDCSLLKVLLGDEDECDVVECQPTSLTCVTRIVPKHHEILNSGMSTEFSVQWSPNVLDVREGDTVTWKWLKLSENSQLEYSVCQVPNPLADCEDDDGTGFNSGPKTVAGQFTVNFNQQGTYFYSGQPASSSGLVMRGQINVIRPPTEARKITVLLGDQEATIDLSNVEEPIAGDGCTPNQEPLADCTEADPTVPDDGYLYFQAHTCYTPVISSVATDSFTGVPGLSGVQLIEGVSLNIEGSGFNDEASGQCKSSVRVGNAPCVLGQVGSSTALTCDPNMEDLGVSYYPVSVRVFGNGIAAMEVSNYNNEGRVVVVPSVESYSPTEGSLAGGTLITIAGSGLQGLSADPVVLLGGQPCALEDVTPISVTCLTPPSATATSATLTVTVMGIQALYPDSHPSYTYSEALTPSVTGMAISGETVTLTGQNLGTDSDKLTVTLILETLSRSLKTEEDEEDEVEKLDEEMDEDYIEDFTDDEEMERMISGYLDESEMSTADAVREEKGKRNMQRRLKLALADMIESPEGFWGTFTGTGAKTFRETVLMGAWRMAGTSTTRTKEDPENESLVTRQERSIKALATEYTCVVTATSETEATCTVSGLPAGSYSVEASLDGAGYALSSAVTAGAVPVVSSISPTSGSVNGGVLLTILGSGFIDGDTTVAVGDSACVVVDVASGTVTCRVPAGADGDAASVAVTVAGGSPITASSTFTYDASVTPTLDSVTPASVSAGGTALTLAGSNFKQGAVDPQVLVGGEECTVTTASNTEVQCDAPELPGGTYDVVVREATYGDSNTQSLLYESGANSGDFEGGFGGSLITITGYGFDPAGGTTVTVCGNECEIVGVPTATEISCVVPPETYTGEDKSCELLVIQPGGDVAATLTYQYLASLTASVTSVSPKRGGTAGGTTLTIDGTGFADSGNVVTIGGSACDVQSESSTAITCLTSAHQGPGEFAVMVDVPDKGFAVTDENGVFFYIDRWSSVFTWGNEPVPSEGQLVVVDEGQTVLLDQSTPVLKMLLIQGGHVVFDDEATEELVLRAEYILVVGGGSLSIGSEEVPFPGEAVIELHGNFHSIELPIYGAKVLAVRDGTLDLHGAHVPITWTYLEATAAAGATSITLADEVTWKAGDQIVIASTGLRFPRNENEVRTINSVSGSTVTFTEPLEFEHVSVTQTLGGREVKTRAEVGLLTRNVKIRGNINGDFSEEIEACGEQFNPNQFATQTCFNGRYGDETGSDQFGATVMIFGKFPDQDLVTGRIEYVEVTEAGQAFQLGRYPLHFHMVGDVSTSYIRGCAVHRTYNRAITIHAANYLTVERNVAYNNMGHAIFTEDGVEQNNVIQYNLAVFTRSSSSLLNVDITPASFWVVNPNNIVRHNAAAGGTHFGYWYRTERHPSGPSTTNSYCPNNEVMGQFFNNTAHSMGRYGLWVFSMDGYHPRAGTCRGSDLVAKWEDFTVWHCDRGAEVVFGTNLQFHNFVALNNKMAGMEMVKMKGGNRLGDSPGIFNSLVACHSALGSDFCTAQTSGIISPKQYTFSISEVTFVNYDVPGSSALSGCSQCKPLQGGFRTQVEGLSFDTSPNRLSFKWEHETIWFDEDGSLSGTVGASVVPWMDILPSDSCATADELSVNPSFPGAVCSPDLNFMRFNVEGPSIEPPSMKGRDLIVTNDHGTVNVPYMVKRLTTEGWMGLLFGGDTYVWYFDDSSQITNITYKATTQLVGSGDYYYVKHNLMEQPDFFGTTGEGQESTVALPDPNTDFHGDYYWDAENREMTYMVSSNLESKRNVREFTKDAGLKRNIKFEVFRNAPTPPPVPTGRPDVVLYWSDVETWKEVPVGSGGHPTEEEYNLPVENDEIIIPPGMWLIVDTETPKLRRVYVYGTLEFDDTMDHYFEATIIYIQGGSVVAGFNKEKPFTHNLEIQLRGSIDPEDPDNEAFPMPQGVPDVGWKAIGVFGYLKLHGVVSGQSWHKLGATAEAGSMTVTLAEAPDASWLNKMVVISTTSKDATESEVRTVVGIDGATLTLDTALEFEHLGVTHTFSDGTSLTLAGEVGLLSRNIVVRGSPTEDSFGGRVVVSRVNQDSVDYVGSVQLDGVLLDNMGQESFTSLDDPRYALAIVGLGAVEDDSSYVSRSSFSISYNVALGLLGTSNVNVEDNVIYFALDSAVKDEEGSNFYRRNLITTVLFLGTFGDRFETQNLNWYGAFQLDNAPNTVLEGNAVAGAEQAGYKTYGEICDDAAQWSNNEVHGTIYGIMSWKKSGQGDECRRIHDFTAWRIIDTAFYIQHYASSIIENVVAADSPLGVNQLIRGPPALSHTFSEKYAFVKSSLFVGASPSHTCTFQKSTTEIMTFYSGKLWTSGLSGGVTGVLFGTFMSGANMAPKKKFSPTTSYPALHGRTEISDNTFINFNTRSCGRNVALMANPESDDAVHPIFTSGLTFVETVSDNYVFIRRANVDLVDPSDCVDMDCDGHKKVVLKDADGSLLSTAGATLISEAEFEWDGDERRGVGDYRIPVPLRQNDDGTAIPAEDKFPNKGIVRDDSCTLAPAWQAWVCKTLEYFMMIIESMDSDTEVRRLSPIALIANPGTNGFVDLLNGPMDRGWCFGYTCQERISTFYAVVAGDQVYEMAMTSTPPQVLRLHTLTEEEVVVLRIFFPKLQRYDIYVGDTFIPPTNIDTSVTKYQLLPEDPLAPEAFFPTISDAVGSNYLQRSAKLLHVVVGKSQIVTIKTTPMITLQSGLVVTESDFYEENLLQNLVDLFGISPDNIRITNIVPENSRRGWTRQGTVTMDVSAEIASAPTTSPDGAESALDAPVLTFEALESAYETAVNKFQEGSCETCASLKTISPQNPPPAEAPPKATEETGSVVIENGTLFSELQQKEEAAALNKSLETVEFSQPSASEILTGVPSYVVVDTSFSTLPSITVRDEEGNIVNNLGIENDPWRFTATLTGGAQGVTLGGTTSVPYVDGAATFTDLSVSAPGEDFSLSFAITYPADAPALPVALSQTFNARAEIPMAVNIDISEDMLNVGQPFTVSIQLVDEDSGELLDGTLFEDQVIVGELLERRNPKAIPNLVKRFYEMSPSSSEIPLEITLDKEAVRYQLITRVSIVPGEWYLEGKTKRMVIYPEEVSRQDDSVTKTVGVELYRGKLLTDLNEELEDAVLAYLIENFNMERSNIVWGPVTVGNKERKMVPAEFEISGPSEQVTNTINDLCRELKSKVLVRVESDCQRGSYRMLHVYVDGEKQKCRRRTLMPESSVGKNSVVVINGTRSMSMDESTLVEGIEVINVTRAETTIGRHKFNRG
ncbi:fibrocystin-L-like isoform X2 [Eriocheir sinensis]|nr:fibrocystin-L-like isoform X2 [Eriocheir sinensis]